MITVGYVTDRKGATPHLIVDGRADCPVVRGRCAIRDPKPLTVDNAPLVCKRCRPALLAAARFAEVEANQRAGCSTLRNGAVYALAATRLVEALEAPADRLARQRRTDEINAQFDAIVAANLGDFAPAA